MTRSWLCVLVLAACGDSAGGGVKVKMEIGDQPPTYGATPFPTDALRDGTHLALIDGLESLVVHHWDLVARHLSALDGFGLRPVIEFPVDGDLDPASVTTDTVGLVSLDSPDVLHAIPIEVHYDAERRVIEARPTSGTVLHEGRRYGAFVTTGIHAADGSPLAHAPALGDAPARWSTTADGMRTLARDDLAGITVFTTQHASAPLVAARATLDAIDPPVLSFAAQDAIFIGPQRLQLILGDATRFADGPRAGLEHWGNDNPTGMAHDHVGVIGTGRFTVARFRNVDTGTDGPSDETFALDGSGTPVVLATEDIPITFILPAAPPPATGYPVVIYGHGLGAGRDQLLSFAEPLTAQGYAVVGIDMVGHGSRYNPTDAIVNLSDKAGFTGATDLPDGFGDRTGLASTFDFFEGFLNVAAVRDSIRQSALDLSRMTQLLRQPALDLSALTGPGGVPHLDTTHLTYIGESFGTVVGTLFAAIEPNIDLYVLDVPGGGILDTILPSSAEIGALALPFITTIYGPKSRLDRWNPLVGMMQTVIDGADPLTYAPHILRDRFAGIGPRSVVALEVVGDQVLANEGTIALAQGLGLDVLAPNLAVPDGLVSIDAPAAGNRDGQTAVLVQYSPATHGANWSSERGTLRYNPVPTPDGDTPYELLAEPVVIAEPLYETLDQVIEILRSHQAGDAPRVKMTKPPVRDFDGDGTPDASDPAPLDPAH